MNYWPSPTGPRSQGHHCGISGSVRFGPLRASTGATIAFTLCPVIGPVKDTHLRTVYSLGVVVLLVASASIVPVTTPAAATAGAERGGSAGHAADAAPVDQNESNSITALEAMEIARNETNGTVVGVVRKQVDNDANGTPAWVVKVVQGNRSAAEQENVRRTLVSVQVHATNGTVLGTRTGTGGDGFSDADESTDDAATVNSLNLSTTRSAINATHIAINESEMGNLTIRGVRLTLRDQAGANVSAPPLVYVVDVERLDGSRVNIIVSARRGQGGIVTVEPKQNE